MTPTTTGEETGRRGQEIYETTLRATLETGDNIGKIVSIDIENRDHVCHARPAPCFRRESRVSCVRRAFDGQRTRLQQRSRHADIAGTIEVGGFDMIRHSFSSLTLREGMELVPAQHIADWNLNAPPRPPSDFLHETLRRLQSFNQHSAKRSYVDALLAEVVPNYPRLKVWHGEPLESPKVGGDVDYLFAPSRGYAATPLVCAATIARRDDFDDRMTQCIAEMAACRDNNVRDGHDLEVHGIVSNGQVWVFYCITRTPEVFVSGAFTMNRLPELLGALDYVIAACADNIP